MVEALQKPILENLLIKNNNVPKLELEDSKITNLYLPDNAQIRFYLKVLTYSIKLIIYFVTKVGLRYQ